MWIVQICNICNTVRKYHNYACSNFPLCCTEDDSCVTGNIRLLVVQKNGSEVTCIVHGSRRQKNQVVLGIEFGAKHLDRLITLLAKLYSVYLLPCFFLCDCFSCAMKSVLDSHK